MNTSKITIDNSGRANFGKKKANMTYSVCEKTNGEIILVPLAEVPINEKWIWENKDILKSVLTGIDQAKKGQFVPDPTEKLDDKAWLEEIDEDNV